MVTLSGGEFGGETEDASGLAINDEFEYKGCIYRKVSEVQAIYIGVA